MFFEERGGGPENFGLKLKFQGFFQLRWPLNEYQSVQWCYSQAKYFTFLFLHTNNVTHRQKSIQGLQGEAYLHHSQALGTFFVLEKQKFLSLNPHFIACLPSSKLLISAFKSTSTQSCFIFFLHSFTNHHILVLCAKTNAIFLEHIITMCMNDQQHPKLNPNVCVSKMI